jgi:hypothetical protein
MLQAFVEALRLSSGGGARACSSEVTQIRVKKKQLEPENLIRLVQLFGLSKSRILPADRIRKAIEAL